MDTDDSLARAISEDVHLSPYDAQWVVRYEAERERLLELFPGRFAGIEHVGSTAIPGLAAKPIIDLLAGVSDFSEADSLLAPLCANGYVTSAEFNATLPDRRWLMRHASGSRTHHLHVVVFGGEQWERHLRFRDLLRGDADAAARYQELKQKLAGRHRQDREAYTREKAAFIHTILSSDFRLSC